MFQVYILPELITDHDHVIPDTGESEEQHHDEVILHFMFILHDAILYTLLLFVKIPHHMYNTKLMINFYYLQMFKTLLSLQQDSLHRAWLLT